MAVLKLNNVTTLTESSGALTLANTALGTPTSVTLTNATFPAGHVLQVVSFETTDAGSCNPNNSNVLLSPSIQMAITPKATGSNILIQFNWGGEASSTGMVFNIVKNTSTLTSSSARVNALGTDRWMGVTVALLNYHSDWDSTPEMSSFNTIDKAGTTKDTLINYGLTATSSGNVTVYTNRVSGNTGESSYERLASSIILTEIAG